MEVLKWILTVLQGLTCVGLVVIIMLQSGKEDGLSALTGNTDSFLARSKAATRDAKLARWTKWVAAAFILLTFFVSMLHTAA